MRGPLAAVAGLVCAAALAGCGEEPRTRPEPRVTVRLTAPADAVVVRGETVEVAGRVVPADARVT
ncbi:MAG TPA: hypothetical protein VN213_04555, partial [Solirubrobacteraceae bacterium]|nr:hypothetical protein [Solirubrobacteraceae bacterium]